MKIKSEREMMEGKLVYKGEEAKERARKREIENEGERGRERERQIY